MNQGVLLLIVVIAAIVSRPLDMWLWKRGRISDRTAAVLLVGRFPLVALLILPIMGVDLLLTALILIPILLIGRLLYPSMLVVMDDTRQELRRQAAAKEAAHRTF